jgi:signal transduction histidine kinase
LKYNQTMTSSNSFARDISLRKYNTVSLLLTLFLIVSAANLIQVAVRIFTAPLTMGAMVFNISGVIVFFLFLYARFFLLKKSYSAAFGIFLITSNLAAALVMFLTGIANWIVFILLIINILSCGIVASKRVTLYLMLFSILMVLLVSFLHNSGLVKYTPDSTSSALSYAIIGALLLYITYRITRIGYGEIEHSYEQAYKYSAALEELNQELDSIVKKRTLQLESSHEREMQSLYAAAVFGRISKSLVHDIATPLSTISGSLNMLKEQNWDPETQELIDLSGKAISQIDRLMSHSQSLVAGTTRNEAFNVNALVRNLLGILRHQLHANGIKIEINIDPDLELYGSSGIFERVLLNLITNAIDAIVVDQKSRKPGVIKLSAVEYNNAALVTVEDNGIGIPEEVAEKIFEADYTSKEDKGNMGMGLYFVQQSVAKYFNGYVNVESELGKGTTFTLFFESAKIDDKIDPERD